MYKPPQNSNRVKSIKSKFENIEQGTKSPEKDTNKNGYRNNLKSSPKKAEKERCEQLSVNEKLGLQRQFSDPARRNIKRTPAFRLDKNLDKTNGFQRNCFNRSTLFENKVKQFSAVKSNCDNNSNVLNSDKNKFLNDMTKVIPDNNTKNNKLRPIMVKSKSSHDFQYIRSKFDKGFSNNNKNIDSAANLKDDKCNEKSDLSDNLNGIDFSILYTEPIPKSLRLKPSENVTNVKIEPTIEPDNIYSSSTLKLSDNPKKVTDSCKVVDSFLFKDNYEKSDKNPAVEGLTEGLTDTLKTALKKPLPLGPPPRKPPRTFKHGNEDNSPNMGKNISFLHVSKELEKNSKAKTASRKPDPKYMLHKLENALRNNKLRAKRQVKADISTTSGEDSDDSLLFRSKTNRTLPRLPSESDRSEDSSIFKLNCLNGLGCANSIPYAKIKEPNSSFFVDSKEEPVYAEPFHHRRDSLDTGKRKMSEKGKKNRDSLYYMSTPVLSDGENLGYANQGSPTGQLDSKVTDLRLTSSLIRQVSAENSSLSSFTSDLDSTPSPMEESTKIKSMIESFEQKTQQNYPPQEDNSNRVENLKNSLRQTLDRSFTYDCAMRDSDSEKNDNETKVSDIISKFQTYIKSMPKYCKPNINKDTLFYCCLIIEKVSDMAQIKYKHPSCVEIPQNIENLCFPESTSVPLDVSNAAQSYSLLITNDKGERTFGYCRRVLPEGSTHCLPLAYCILSKYRAPRFYKKILLELESRHGIKNKFRDELISQFYNQKFPRPGEPIRIDLTSIEPPSFKTRLENKENESVDVSSFVRINKSSEYGSINKAGNSNGKVEHIFVTDKDLRNMCATPSFIVENDQKTELVLTLHADTRYEDSDLKRLHRLPEDVLLKIFSSMLLERKVILICSKISTLSSCVDSLQSILYPFTWHHTFIPILPESLWDIVESPTPVICGVLSKEVVNYHRIENGIVVDLDSGTVLVEEGDENKILSGSMQKVWKRSLAFANKLAASTDYVHSVCLSDAYLRVFIVFLKDYKKFFVDGIFQKEDFMKSGKTKGIRRFLKMFTETYMFLAFLDSFQSNPENLFAFDKKIEMYGSDESSFILDKLLEWNR